jgi:hypothetical protein
VGVRIDPRRVISDAARAPTLSACTLKACICPVLSLIAAATRFWRVSATAAERRCGRAHARLPGDSLQTPYVCCAAATLAPCRCRWGAAALARAAVVAAGLRTCRGRSVHAHFGPHPSPGCCGVRAHASSASRGPVVRAGEQAAGSAPQAPGWCPRARAAPSARRRARAQLAQRARRGGAAAGGCVQAGSHSAQASGSPCSAKLSRCTGPGASERTTDRVVTSTVAASRRRMRWRDSQNVKTTIPELYTGPDTGLGRESPPVQAGCVAVPLPPLATFLALHRGQQAFITGTSSNPLQP